MQVRMTHRMPFGLALTALLAGVPVSGQQQFADLGSCSLESGAVIEDCRVGYRTFGSLNASRSNAVLFVPWYMGTSAQASGLVGPEGFVDPEHWFVIVVDPIGNGVSISPSNSSSQSGSAFPTYSFRDMVSIDRRLLEERLGLDQIHGVLGPSMGGIAAFEWLASHDDFVGRAVPIVGSPQMRGYDFMRWSTEIQVLESAAACNCIDAGRFIAIWENLVAYTPQYLIDSISREGLAERLEELGRREFHPYDRLGQARAILGVDVTRGRSIELLPLARAVDAEALVIVAAEDRSVHPESAREVAEAMGAEILILDNACGHLAFSCAGAQVGAATRAFLRR